MSNVRRKSDNQVSYSTSKELYNPFPDVLYERKQATSPKVTKRAWKCFQLVLICQKLLKPFSGSTKNTDQDHTDHKWKFTNGFRHQNRLPQPGVPCMPTTMVDNSVQTNIRYPMVDNNTSNEDFPYEVEDSVKEGYWDLDIDSAIVGDYNSMSGFSIDEQIDPHYATIKLSVGGKFLDDQIFSATINHGEETGRSNNSSPRSGVYSKIVKPARCIRVGSQISELCPMQSSGRLNFDQIMSIRTQLGLSHRDAIHCYQTNRTDTPDIPRRMYGSNVVNFITELRKSGQYKSGTISPSSLDIGKESSPGDVYSPIWTAEKHYYSHISKFSDAPLSEPIAPKRALNKILHQLNPTYRDDSSEEASSISFTSPFKAQYSYPRNFSDNYSRKSSLGSVRKSSVTLLTDEMNRFRHMDSEVDVNVPHPSVKDKQGTMNYRGSISDPITKFPVPLTTAVGHDDFHLVCDERIFLQPLMERSCEEDYFNRDILSSLDYINV